MFDLLQINVSKTSYKAGDPVSGSVSLCNKSGPSQDIDIESISVTFSGRLSPSREWPLQSESVQIFAHTKTLLLGPTTLRIPSHGLKDQYSWPFDFNFPIDSRDAQYDGPPATSLSLFNTDHNQPLPPSLSTSSNDENPNEAVSIVYELQTTLLSPSTTKYRPAHYNKRLELEFHVPRHTEQISSECTSKLQRIVCQTVDLYPEEHRKIAKRPFRLGEKIGLKPASTDHLPKAVFDVKLQTLSSAIIGEPLSMFLYINYDFGSSTIRTPPTVRLKKVEVWFREDTSMLVPKPGATVGKQEQVGWNKASQLAAQNFDQEISLTNGFLDLREIVDMTLKDDLVPNFKTFNIARSYGSKVNLTLECAGKTFFIHGNYNPCTLLAKQFDPNAVRYAQSSAPAVMPNTIDDPPPPYESVESVEHTGAPSQSSQSSQHSRQNRRHNGIFHNMILGGGGGIGGGGGGC